MEENTRKDLAMKLLEGRLKKSEGILPFCMEDGCGKIGIDLNGNNQETRYWMSRDENPSLYDKALRHYDEIFDGDRTNGLSHSYCPECVEKILNEID